MVERFIDNKAEMFSTDFPQKQGLKVSVEQLQVPRQ